VLLVTVKFLLHEERGGGIDSNLSVQGACIHRFSVGRQRGATFFDNYFVAHTMMLLSMVCCFLYHHEGQSDIG